MTYEDRVLYQGSPIPRIENNSVEIIVGSCCYDYSTESLTATEAIAFGSLVLELGKELLRRESLE